MKTPPDLKRWTTIGDYIEDRRKSLLLSRRALARETKMSPSYLTNVVNGYHTPGAETCNRVSDYFGDPRDIALRLCGWLEPNQDQDDESGVRELALLIKDDADLRLFLQFYKSQPAAMRRRMLNLLKKVQADSGDEKSGKGDADKRKEFMRIANAFGVENHGE